MSRAPMVSLRRDSTAISPTAHYTGQVWSRNGLSHPELATREGHSGGSRSPSPKPSGGGGQPPPSGGGAQNQPNPGASHGAAGALSSAQAEDILRSIGQEELRTRRDRLGRTRRAAEPQVKDW